MASTLILPRPFERRADAPLEVDAKSRLGSTITHCIPFNGIYREIVTGADVTRGSGASDGIDDGGTALQSSTSAACASLALDLSAYNKLTLSFRMAWDAFANNDALAMEFTPNAFAANGIFVDPNESSTGQFQVACGASGAAGAKSFARPSAGIEHHYLFALDRSVAGGVVAAYVDGVAQSLATQVNNIVSGTFANSTLYLFSRNNAALFGAGRIRDLVIRGGYLAGEDEAREECDYPERIYVQSRRLWVSVGASSLTVTPATGHITLAGHVPTVTLSQVIQPTTGHRGLTGYQPMVAQAVVVAPATGHFVLSGHAPNILQAVTIAPLAGHVSFAGHQPTVTQSIFLVVTPNAGHLSFTGYAPSIARTTNQTTTPLVGHLRWTGYSPKTNEGTIGALGGGNRPGYINRYPRPAKPEGELARTVAEPSQPSPTAQKERELSPREKKRLRKQVERALLSEQAQRRGFDQLESLLATLQAQAKPEANVISIEIAYQALQDDEDDLLLLAVM